MNYPLISEYIEAIKSAEDNFATLTNLRPVLDDEGQPIMTSGNFAVVFKMKDVRTGKLHAVKCFLKEQEGRKEAYRLIVEELENVKSAYLTPIKYLDKELFVNTILSDETEFPVLLMDWVEGVTLDRYLRKHIDDQYELSMLVYRFSRLAIWLLPQPFAHGDLKPDNILVRNDGTLVLVDYDGMYVPAMKGQKARELENPDFRHPARAEEDFDEHIDDFTLASILLSLKVISLKPELMEQYGASDRLLFSDKDYSNLYESQALDDIKELIDNSELAKLISIFFLSLFKKVISVESLYLEEPIKPSLCNSSASTIYGEVIKDELDKIRYIEIYDKDIICDVTDIETEAIEGLRIIKFTYGRIKRRYGIESITRYGLINKNGKLVSNYEYSSLSRRNDGTISASYSVFSFHMNARGEPLFEYNIKAQDGTTSPKCFPLMNIDAVSACYYGIAIFVKKGKQGVVDYKGNVLIQPMYDDIKIDRSDDWLTAVLYDKEHYKGFDARPSESLTKSITYLLHKSKYWPLDLYELNRKYYVTAKDKGIFFLENKDNYLTCLCMYDGIRAIISPEFQKLNLLNYLNNDSSHFDSLYIAVNLEGKYGIISMPTGFEEVNPDTGDPIYNEIRTVCPFDYDYISNGGLEKVILVKNGKEGLFSCSLNRIIVECVIPTIDHNTQSILPYTMGESLIGCRERIEDDRFFTFKYRYLFYDLEGNKVLELPNGWTIRTGFKQGFAEISNEGRFQIKKAKIDKQGNITIFNVTRREPQSDSYDINWDDIDRMYRDAFEDDPSMEWNID